LGWAKSLIYLALRARMEARYWREEVLYVCRASLAPFAQPNGGRIDDGDERALRGFFNRILFFCLSSQGLIFFLNEAVFFWQVCSCQKKISTLTAQKKTMEKNRTAMPGGRKRFL